MGSSTRRAVLAVALTVTLVACSGGGAAKETPASEAVQDGDQVVQTPQNTPDPDPATNTAAAPAEGTFSVHCGYVRWNVKTGTDSQAVAVDLHPQMATIAGLLVLKSPLPKVNGSHPGPNVGRYINTAEMHTFTIHATLTEFAGEADSDIHLVLADSAKHTMIAEIPNPACVKGGPFKTQITNARKAFLAKYPSPPVYPKPFAQTHQPVTVTGVGFFDYVHGQSGVAKNGVELHPILDIVFN